MHTCTTTSRWNTSITLKWGRLSTTHAFLGFCMSSAPVVASWIRSWHSRVEYYTNTYTGQAQGRRRGYGRIGSRHREDNRHDRLDLNRQSNKLNRRQWITKHTSGICGVGTMMMKRKQQRSPTCSRCGKEEDETHVWLCRNGAASTVWEASIQKQLQDWVIQ